jgi:hypothetical protein
MTGRFLNHRVLVGPKAKIEVIKDIFEEKVKGDYKLMLREQPTDA